MGGTGGGVGGGIAGGGNGGSISTGTGGFHVDLGVGGRGAGGTGGKGGGQGGETVDAQIMLLPDGGCGSEYPLWDAVAKAEGGRVVGCYPFQDACVYGSYYQGYVVVDGEGRVVYNGYFCMSDGSCDTEGMQNWLATLAGYRWPCLAGQTIEYCCTPFY